MDMNNDSIGGHEPRRRLDFGNSKNVPDISEAQVVENHENKTDDHTAAHVNESIDNIHARLPAELIPKINMEFETENDAFLFYLSYAKAAGFGVRMSKFHKNKETDHILDRIFCCSREGKRTEDIRDANVKSHRPETKCACPAKMKISCRQANMYRVVKFIAKHNHNCVTPSKSHLFRSHRKMTSAQKAEVDMVLSCGIAQRETMELLAKQVGGAEHLGFLRDDCKNYLHSKRTKKMMLDDTGGVLQYLQRKHGEDPNFYSAIQVDEDALITNIFWADAKMRSDYSHFGDVVSFDTTYRKHKDGRPIALFVGINNHKQTIVFGVALLYDETATTFSWLFDTFAIAMSGKKPQTMLTDQDKAMSKALASQWPETYHRLCVWHINQNAATHLSNIFAQHRNFARDFSSCKYDHDYEDDFINAWTKMIKNYELHDNGWLKELFKIRKKWALVYGRETFCGDMSTTQRSESMNSVIKRYISYKNELSEFFEHFERLLKDRRYKESIADFKVDQSEPSSTLQVEISKHATRVYTQKIYDQFHKEVCKSYDCNLEILGEKDTINEFKVTSFGEHHHHNVVYDSVNRSVSCSCKKFEFAGILCSHALKVLNYKQAAEIPDQYIKKRWMKTAKRQSVNVNFQDMSQVDPKELMAHRYRELCQFHNQLITRVAESQKGYEIVKDGLLKLLEQLDASFEKSEVQDLMHVSDPITSNETIMCKNVRGVKPKDRIGYKTSKRPKHCLEKATRRKKVKPTMPISENQEIVIENHNFDLVNEITPQESDAQLYRVGMSLLDTNNLEVCSSMDRGPREGRLTDLLMMIDPNVTEQQAFMDYNSNQLLLPDNLLAKEQEGSVGK